jgi:hypothetical protein
LPAPVEAATAQDLGGHKIGHNGKRADSRSVLNCLVRKGGLEPPRFYPPDPKSGASANSATFARSQLYKVVGVLSKYPAERSTRLDPRFVGLEVRNRETWPRPLRIVPESSAAAFDRGALRWRNQRWRKQARQRTASLGQHPAGVARLANSQRATVRRSIPDR